MNITHLIHTSVDDCRSSIPHATLEQLRAAQQWADGRPGHSTRAKLLASAIRSRESLPDDLTLLKTAHPHDVPRIASATPSDVLAEAYRWAVRSLPGDSPRRRAIESAHQTRTTLANRHKGGAQ